MLKLDKISKVYRVGTFGGKELHAVSDVSFEIGEGEVVSLIGESGSGKSTIGKMILGLIPISSGAIISNGVDVSTLQGSELVHTSYFEHPEILDLLALHMAWHGDSTRWLPFAAAKDERLVRWLTDAKWRAVGRGGSGERPTRIDLPHASSCPERSQPEPATRQGP